MNDEWESIFTASDVAGGWIRALMEAKSQGIITEEQLDRLSERSAQFSAEISLHRRMKEDKIDLSEEGDDDTTTGTAH